MLIRVPHSAILFLRHQASTPDKLKIRMITPGGAVEYDIQVMKSQQYTLEEIFEKKLLLLIPLRKNTLNKKLDVFSPSPLEGVCEYLFMDFHSLMNNEIFYSYQPLYLRDGIHALNESELYELDRLAELLSEPDKNIEQIEYLLTTNEKFSVLTNNTQNIYYDTFR